MNVKELLKQALDAKIAGDQDVFETAMKQVMAAKVSNMMAEGSSTVRPHSDFVVETDFPVSYQGELYGATLGIDTTHYQAATQGNYSSRASDPEEYYGATEEHEWQIVWAELHDETGAVVKMLSAEEAKGINMSDSEYETVDRQVNAQAAQLRADVDY